MMRERPLDVRETIGPKGYILWSLSFVCDDAKNVMMIRTMMTTTMPMMAMMMMMMMWAALQH